MIHGSSVWIIITLHLLIYAIPPFLGSLLSKSNQINLNYLYVGMLFTLVQFYDTLYAIQLDDNLFLFGGDIAYSALLFASIYVIYAQPRPEVVRNLIYFILTISIMLFLLFSLIAYSFSTAFVVNYLNIPSVFLEFTFRSLILSVGLYSAEIILMMISIRYVRKLINSQQTLKVLGTLIYLVFLVMDGILYPIGINLLFPGSDLSISNGIVAKLIFGLGFGMILYLLLSFKPLDFSDLMEVKSPLRSYIIPPSAMELEKQLNEAEEQIQMLEKIVPICSWCRKLRDDEGYWDQLEIFMRKNSHMIFSHGVCDVCAEGIEEDIRTLDE